MLVLTRKLGERIRIGDSITVTVVRIQLDKVRIGIDAPADVRVFREEVLQRSASAADTVRPVGLPRTRQAVQPH